MKAGCFVGNIWAHFCGSPCVSQLRYGVVPGKQINQLNICFAVNSDQKIELGDNDVTCLAFVAA